MDTCFVNFDQYIDYTYSLKPVLHEENISQHRDECLENTDIINSYFTDTFRDSNIRQTRTIA